MPKYLCYQISYQKHFHVSKGLLGCISPLHIIEEVQKRYTQSVLYSLPIVFFQI